MVLERIFPLFLDLSFLILLILLLFDDSKELVTLSLSLLSEHDLTLYKLFTAGNIKILCIQASFFSLLSLFSAGFALTLFEGALCSQSIDFSLSVGSTLLKLTEALDLQLFFLLLSAGFFSFLLFFGDAFGVVTDNFQILFALQSLLLVLAILGSLVGNFNLGEHASVTLFLFLSQFHVGQLLHLNLLDHELLLAFKLFTLLEALLFTLLDLVDDHSGTTALGLLPQNFALIFSFQSL